MFLPLQREEFGILIELLRGHHGLYFSKSWCSHQFNFCFSLLRNQNECAWQVKVSRKVQTTQIQFKKVVETHCHKTFLLIGNNLPFKRTAHLRSIEMLFHGMRPSEVDLLRRSLQRCLSLLPPPLESKRGDLKSEGDDEEEHYLYIPTPSELLIGSASARLRRAADALTEHLDPSASYALSKARTTTHTSSAPFDKNGSEGRGGVTETITDRVRAAIDDVKSGGSVLTGRPQIASYIIDRTFDDHKVMLRKRLRDALAEIEMLKKRELLSAKLEELRERESDLRDELERSEMQRSDLMLALENSQSSRREALVRELSSRRMFLAWHQRILFGLINTFTVCEEWRDWQLETFLSSRIATPDVLAFSSVGEAPLASPEESGTRQRLTPTPPNPPPPPHMVKVEKEDTLPAITQRKVGRSTTSHEEVFRNEETAKTKASPAEYRPALPYGEGPSTIRKATIHRQQQNLKSPRGTTAAIVAKLAR